MEYSIGSVDWTPYVLSLLREEEKTSGFPRKEGLRRLTRELVGECDEPSINILQFPTLLGQGIKTKINDNTYCFVYNPAIVQAFLSVNTKQVVKNYIGYGEANIDNTKDFAMWPLSLAIARAEVKCYRQALQLTNVYAIEEMGELSKTITEAQISLMKFFCQKNDIDLNKWLISKTKKEYDLSSVRSIPSDLGVELVRELTQVKRKDS